MVKTRLYLDCRYTPKGSPAPLKICIYKDNVRALIPMNININPDEWNSKKQRPRDDEMYSMIKARLGKIEVYVFKQDTEGVISSLFPSTTPPLIKFCK